jgi:tRNA pseudouridine55 synthase
MSKADKAYDATIAFGSATDTEDAEGAVVASAEVPDGVLDPAFAERVLAGFLGPQKQRPPAYSAIKVNGTVAHRAARSGSPLELAERDISVFEARLLGVDATLHTWSASFRVSKGTYIRSLARDLGEAVGVPSHLSGLRRTASGPLLVEDAHRLDELTDVEGAFTEPVAALDLPVIQVEEAMIANGSPLDIALSEGLAVDTDVAVVCNGVLRAIYRVTSNRLIPRVVLPSAEIS